MRGLAYRAKGDLDRAIGDYDQAIRLEPDNADAHNGRGVAWADKGDYAQAVRDYDRALQINPNHERAAVYKALAEKELAKTKKKSWF